jgi:hypothetical protein
MAFATREQMNRMSGSGIPNSAFSFVNGQRSTKTYPAQFPQSSQVANQSVSLVYEGKRI